MKTYKIIFEREKCTGAAACVTLAPDTWQLDLDGKAICKKSEFTEGELQKQMDVAEACPVSCIHIEDEEGNRLI